MLNGFNRHSNQQSLKAIFITCCLLFITGCSSKFEINEQQVIGPISQHQSLYLINYETPQRWLDYENLQQGVFSEWLLRGFKETLNQNAIITDGMVVTKKNKKEQRKQIKSILRKTKPEGVLTIKAVSAHGKMETQLTHHVDNIVYKFAFFSYKSGKKEKVWESKGTYYLSNALDDDSETLYHAYVDVFVNQVLMELQQAGLLKPLTLPVIP